MRKTGFKFFLFTFIFALFFTSCSNRSGNRSNRVYLDNWRYSLDGKIYRQLPKGRLGNLEDYVPNRRGYITLHSDFELPWKMMTDDVGIALGRMMVASKVYINGNEIGTIGIFPPKAFDAGHAHTSIKIDSKLLNPSKKNTVEIVLWVEGKGGISGRPFISSYVDTSRYVNMVSFNYSKLIMIFSWSMVLTSIAYFLFYMHQKKERQFLDYALMNVWTAVFLIPFWLSEIPNAIGCVPVVWWYKILLGSVALVVAYYAASFISSFLGIEQSKRVKIVRKINLGISIIYTLFIPSLTAFYKYLFILFILLFFQLSYAIITITREFFKKNELVKPLLLGFSPVIFTVLVDFVIKVICKRDMVVYVTIYGWQMTAILFLSMVTRRYAKFRNEYDYLYANLEKEVKDRTAELTKLNAELERRQYQADQDMELAVHVQKSFYPQNLEFLGWDVAVSFNPLSGVSGDLYDFYVMEGILRGFGLFDVSGHGISSGLVTMLAKNAIFHAFRTTLPLSLDEAMKIVNEQVIRVKGDIENYLTGCMFRIDKENPGKLEFVNAGAPYPIFKGSKKKNSELLMPDKRKPQYGMIGVSGLDVKFQVLRKTMKPGDVLVLYTDGISETENTNGEPFGKERIMQVLERVKGSAKEIADAIFDDLKAFAGFENLDDDITILVMKKTEELPEEIEEIGELEEL